MPLRRKAPGTLRFILIAVVFMLLADHFIFGGKRSYIEDAKERAHKEKLAEQESPKLPPVKVDPGAGKEFFESPPMEGPDIANAPDTPLPEETIPEPTKTIQPKAEDKPVPVVPVSPSDMVKPIVRGHPKIAIIIDDVGMDIKHSHEVIEGLPAPVTLAFLPYAPKVRELSAEAKAKGHHIIIHVPMEAMDKNLNIGPGGLKTGMSYEELQKAFEVMLGSFTGYEGINNHMGSRLTQDGAAMEHVMKILKEKGLFFVDSKTIGNSVAWQKAAQEGVPYAERDVFLDHVETIDFARAALLKTEKLAERRGYAVAIGHPKAFTIEALKEWIPTLEAKGITLVPVRELLVEPKGR